MKNNNLKIAIAGSGYVGMSLSVLLSSRSKVILYDIDKSRVNKINNLESTVKDNLIDEYLSSKNLDLSATTDRNEAYKDADIIIMALPTNFIEEKNKFDTSVLDNEISHVLESSNQCLIVIKSTIPIGHTEALKKKYKTKRILFSPEFLREGNALEDNLNPSRIIVGDLNQKAKEFGELLKSVSLNEPDLMYMNSTEAESVKLFSNSFLAMRVSFFNELDSFALSKSLNTKKIIEGVCKDNRIGNSYNNPSFGYGGYCLPKDTKQLLSDFKDIPQSIIGSIIESNKIRKDFISNHIIKKNIESVGFYRLIMKSGSDNFRSSAVEGIIKRLKNEDVNVYIYEPNYKDKYFLGIPVGKDLKDFKNNSDIVLANRLTKEIMDIQEKIFSRDIFSNN